MALRRLKYKGAILDVEVTAAMTVRLAPDSAPATLVLTNGVSTPLAPNEEWNGSLQRVSVKVA